MGGDHLWEAISAVAEASGLVIVVVSLVYLAVQTRLTRKAAQYSSLIGLIDAHSKWRAAIFENPELAALVARANLGEELTDAESLQIQNLHMELFVATVLGTYTADNEAPRAEEHYLMSILRNNPSVVMEWKRQRDFMAIAAPEFANEIDARLAAEKDP